MDSYHFFKQHNPLHTKHLQPYYSFYSQFHTHFLFKIIFIIRVQVSRAEVKTHTIVIVSVFMALCNCKQVRRCIKVLDICVLVLVLIRTNHLERLQFNDYPVSFNASFLQNIHKREVYTFS